MSDSAKLWTFSFLVAAIGSVCWVGCGLNIAHGNVLRAVVGAITGAACTGFLACGLATALEAA